MRSTLVLTAVALSSASGCFAAGYAAPPVRVAVGASAIAGDRPARATPSYPVPPGTTVAPPSTVASIVTTLEPLQLVPSMMGRPVEFAVGWSFEPTGAGATPIHGLDVELGWVLFAGGLSRAVDPPPRPSFAMLRPIPSRRECSRDAACGRLTARLRAGVLIMPGEATIGMRYAVQLAGEITGFARWEGSEGGGGAAAAAGYASAGWGEGGAGLFVEASQSDFGGDRWWQVTGGVTVRIPASFAFAGGACFACVLALGNFRIH